MHAVSVSAVKGLIMLLVNMQTGALVCIDHPFRVGPCKNCPDYRLELLNSTAPINHDGTGSRFGGRYTKAGTNAWHHYLL
jgi:hypothetical protein